MLYLTYLYFSFLRSHSSQDIGSIPIVMWRWFTTCKITKFTTLNDIRNGAKSALHTTLKLCRLRNTTLHRRNLRYTFDIKRQFKVKTD